MTNANTGTPPRAHSWADSAQVPCPQCSQPLELEMWLVVDAAERPDLVARIRNGALHDAPCPHCGHEAQVDAPLLIFTPPPVADAATGGWGEGLPPLLFSPAQATTAEQDQEQAAGLLSRLRESLGDAWRDEWLAEGLPGVPRELLPLALSDGLEAALQRMQAQAAQVMEQLRREDPDAYRQLEETIQQIVVEPPAGSKPAGGLMADKLIAWIQTPDWQSSEEYLQEHAADLLTDEAEAALAMLQQANPGHAAIPQHQALLQRCREIGIEAAYQEFHAVRTVTQQAAQDPAAQALAALLQVDSVEGLETALTQHPVLLELPTLEQLAVWGLEAQQADQTEAAHQLLALLAALLERYNHTHAAEEDPAAQARFVALHENLLPAAQSLDEALAAGLRASLGWALNTLGNAHAVQGDHAAAVEAYSRAIGHAPEEAMLYRNRAGEYIEMERWAEAQADIEQAATLEPDAPRLGQLRLILQRMEKRAN